MREWSLRVGDPLALTLACDARLGPTDYVDDHIWELSLGGGEPPALALHTTYGLRARNMRLFPRFCHGEITITDPADFANAPTIHQNYPNYVELSFSPFPNIDVTAEYWVPQSHASACRLKIENRKTTDSTLLIEWIAQLAPTDGQRMAPVEIQAVTTLAGTSGGLAPVVFMTGGARAGSGSYPSLALRMELTPGEARIITWVQAGLADTEASFNLARNIAALNWDAEVSRLGLLNSGQVELYTGDADWDAAFMLAQKQAFSLLVGPTSNLPTISFVLSRQPDQGYSIRGDGSDYNHLWNGQSTLEAFHLAGFLLPAAAEQLRGIVRNFLADQTEVGFIDWKVGLGGQRSKLLAAPLLACLAWRIFEFTEDQAFLEEAFPGLLQFLQAWFAPERDRDQDGIPEWDHSMQAGAEDHPVYSRWHPWSQGVDITTAESIALCSLLFREASALIDIARQIGKDDAIPGLRTIAEKMAFAVEAAWDDQADCYLDWDRDTHRSTHGEQILNAAGSGLFPIGREFELPIRLLVDIRTDETIRRHPFLFVHGAGVKGHNRVERINDEQFYWTPGWGRMTGRYVYRSLERIEVHGLEPEDQFIIQSVGYDFQDHSLLAPLWAGIPGPERAGQFIAATLANTNQFWQAFGIPACVRLPIADTSFTLMEAKESQPAANTEVPVTTARDRFEGIQICSSANLIWNCMVGEGLVRYGQRERAAELVNHLMAATIQSLKREGAFRRYYHAWTGQGAGERNALNGLAPLGLFLYVLGVRLISPTRVALEGTNPFPWPVTVKYRGLTVLRQKDKTSVIFADGQTVTVTDPAPHIISLER